MKKEKMTLDQTHPELCKQWHPTKNGDLKPTDVTAGSNKKVWWFLPYDDPETGHHDFEWQASVYHRAINGSGCPFQSHQALWTGFNDLKTLRPQLALEWNYEKNGSLRPEHVMIGSHKKVWWRMPYTDPETGKAFIFEWEAKINNRALLGVGCPYLRGLLAFPGFNDLASRDEDLAKQWHPTRNGSLRPENVTYGSKKKVWWYLPYDDPKTGHHDFEWQATVCDRNNGDGCPFISGHAVWKNFNDICTTHPDVAKTWHPEKNGDSRPDEFTAGSGKKVWWKIEHLDVQSGKTYILEWEEVIRNRISNPDNPHLANRLYPGFNDLVSRFPSIAAEWNYQRNGDLRPEMFTYGSKKQVWWIVECEGKTYEWLMSINARTSQGQGCPDLKMSRLERVVDEILKQHKIAVKKEKSLEELKELNKSYCRYDFYLKTKRVIVECDGLQHFQMVKAFGGEDGFKVRKENDNVKNQCAFSNNIPLLRIPYIYDPIKDKVKVATLVLDFIQTKTIPQEIIDFYSQFEFSNYVQCVKQYYGSIEEAEAS